MAFIPSAPGLLFRPDIPINVRLDNFNFQNITDTAFETVSIDVPQEPTIQFPDRPNVDDPEQPIAPEINLDEFTPEQLLSLEASVACQDRVDIAIPGKLNFREWDEEVPVFEVPEPDGRVDWEYEEFSYALSKVLTDKYDLLVLPTEYLSRLQQRNEKIWRNDQDWFKQRGESNTYLDRKDKDNEKNANGITSWTIIENYKTDVELKKLFVAGRQSHEEILRQHHDVKQKLNFSFVQSVMSNGVRHFNACVQKFNAQLQTYRELANVYIGEINRQGIIIQDLIGQMRISEELANYNSAVLQRIRSQVLLQKGIIQFFQSQMELAKAELRVEVLQTQIESLEIQIFAELNRALVDEIRQDIVEQEAEIAKTKVVKLEAIKQRLEANIETARTQLSSAREKFAGDRSAFNTIQQARSEQHGNFRNEVQSREDLIRAQLRFDQARGIFSRENVQAQLLEIQLRQERLIEKFERDLAESTATTITDQEIAANDSTLATARVRAREAVRQAELDAQRTLASSDITQSLIHELSAG